MKPFFKISRLCWAVFAASLMLLAVTIIVRRHGLPQGLHPDNEMEVLLAEKERLAPFNAESVSHLRTELARFEAPPAKPDWLPPTSWQTQALPSETDGITRTRYTTGAISWTCLVTFISKLEVRGQIESLDIRSRGSRTKREIATVEITVRSSPGTTRRSTGAMFPDAEGPASARKVGRGPSLRWSSRPDPPGRPSAIVLSTQLSQPNRL
ncbi:hypothetical protein OH491_01575 [Termitidicoccus mucosus]|uniref:Uncharacterized protein n=1 Tax=Termitidicoccus mucosus TaxID=1184151 RepID=A0A178IMV9_9BACT|nr:hypothetical protein AW736_07980 [Opitutaceae bacterium TSB47]